MIAIILFFIVLIAMAAYAVIREMQYEKWVAIADRVQHNLYSIK